MFKFNLELFELPLSFEILSPAVNFHRDYICVVHQILIFLILPIMKDIFTYIILSATLVFMNTDYLKAQFHIDFETEASTALIQGEQAAVVDNPDLENNDSQKSAYYRKIAGNWNSDWRNKNASILMIFFHSL